MSRILLTSVFLLLALAMGACDDHGGGAAATLTPEQATFARDAKARLGAIKDDLSPIQMDLHKSPDLRQVREAVDKAMATAEQAVDQLTAGGPMPWDQKKSAVDAALKDLADKAAQAKDKAKMGGGMDTPVM